MSGTRTGRTAIWSARRSQPDRSNCGGRCADWSGKVFAHVFTLPLRKRWIGQYRASAAWNNLATRARAFRHHRRRAWLLRRVKWNCWRNLATQSKADADGIEVGPPDGRKAIFVGDLVDRGPKIPEVLRLVMAMVDAGTALCVPGNHDMKLMQKLRGKDVQMTHGLADSCGQQLDRESRRNSGASCASFWTILSAIMCSMTASWWSRTRA